jgi:superfamily II DNA or RNA helicase
LLVDLPQEDNWHAMSVRSRGRFLAWYLIGEDPQRRLDVKPVETLAHQASIVRHVLEDSSLSRVLIADEVGLGKTVEAGLIVQELLAQDPTRRILYLAPAKLVKNVRREFFRLGLDFRMLVSDRDRDATVRDSRIIGSIHLLSRERAMKELLDQPRWDVVVVDECHHLSDWAKGGGKPVNKYRLVKELLSRLDRGSRVIFLSGTPHQGTPERFENLIRLLADDGTSDASAAKGRIIYRTKEHVRDWDGQPLFPARRVNPPIVLDLGDQHRTWLKNIHLFFEPAIQGGSDPKTKGAVWRSRQAQQWATSSIQAGIGYLVRQAIRHDWTLKDEPLAEALGALRPYRNGPRDEDVADLFTRISREIGRQDDTHDVDDIEDDEDEDEETPHEWKPDRKALAALLRQGLELLKTSCDAKWNLLHDRVLKDAGDDKVVLFAQPIETVIALSSFLERKTGIRPSLIIGNQSDEEREREIERFWRPEGPRHLISSRAGGEGLNLQVAWRLVHVDVPWNPMEMEQRVGRVHRFKSRRTITVDTIVVKNSREVDAYRIAREKLKEIASTMVPDDHFDMLYSRVMSIVPPVEFQGILGERPLGPFTDEERRRLSDIVSRGFERWKSFHDLFAGRQRQIAALERGTADWEDVRRFAESHLKARPGPPIAALGFLWKDGEIVNQDRTIESLEIDGQVFACGDYGGAPLSSPNGTGIARLGLNSSILAKAIQRLAQGVEPTGAGHYRWPEGMPPPISGLETPFGLLVFARQSLNLGQRGSSEAGLSITILCVPSGGEVVELSAEAKPAAFRGLSRAGIRQGAPPCPELIERMRMVEDERAMALRIPSDSDRERGIRHVVFPLLAAIVTS